MAERKIVKVMRRANTENIVGAGGVDNDRAQNLSANGDIQANQ